MTKHKNQHYIPQFYLRNFSHDGIGLYRYSLTKKRSERSRLNKTCASRGYYVEGPEAAEFEKRLSALESCHAKILQKIMDKCSLGILSSENFLSFCMFLLLTRMRNPAAKKEIVNIANHSFDLTEDITSRWLHSLEDHSPNLEAMLEVIKNPISIADLLPILLINKTKRPFVTSDSPVVFYNYIHVDGINLDGCLSQGLLVFLPLSEKITLCLFDSAIYEPNVITPTGNINLKYYRPNIITPTGNINLTNKRDVNALNRLQLLNADEYVIHSKLEHTDYISSVLHDDKLEGLRVKSISSREKIEYKVGEDGFTHIYQPKPHYVHRFSFFEENERYIADLKKKVAIGRKFGQLPNLFRNPIIADHLLPNTEQESLGNTNGTAV